MHDPAACGARAAQHSSRHALPAETDASGTATQTNAASSRMASSARARKTTRKRVGYLRFIRDARNFVMRLSQAQDTAMRMRWHGRPAREDAQDARATFKPQDDAHVE